MFLQKLIEWFEISREVTSFERKEERRVKERYYVDPYFRSVDKALKRAYLFKNPFSISRKFWGEHCYGETPLTSLETIGKRAMLISSDRFIDLGAGRGRGVFFVRHRFGCQAIGVERVPSFVTRARKVQCRELVDHIEFFEADLAEEIIVSGNVFYLAWTCFSEELVELLTRRFENLPVGVRVITISFPIPSQLYTCIDSFTVPFAWGNGDVFIQQKLG